MDNIRNMFTLGGGGPTRGGGASPIPRRSNTDNDEQSWERLAGGDDMSAPNVAGQFGRQGGGGQFDPREGGENVFTLGVGNPTQAPPAEITQPWGETRERPTRDPPGSTRPIGGFASEPPQMPEAPSRTIPYSGLAAAVARWKTNDAETVERELNWQRRVEGDKARIALFQEMAGGLQDFKTYLFIKPGSAYCTIVHSPMKFMAISEATRHLQGRFIGFIGDRTVSREPTAVLFPTVKTWQWIKATVATEGPTLIAYYDEDGSRQGTLWTPGEGCTTGEGHVPRLLHIPLLLFELIRNERAPAHATRNPQACSIIC